MNTLSEAPPIVRPRRAITYHLTRWDLFANFLTIFLRNWIIQVFIVAALLFNGWLWLGPGLTNLVNKAFPEFDGGITVSVKPQEKIVNKV